MNRWIRPYCLVAGGMDSLTGLLLVAAPSQTLRLMGLAATPEETIYLRFIGVFVGAVGLSYLYPSLLAAATRPAAQRFCLHFTTLVRFCVALFVVVAVASGSLEPAWISVAVTDGALATVQIRMLQSSRFDVAC